MMSFGTHTGKELSLRIELSMNFNPNSQLPAIRVRISALGFIWEIRSPKAPIVICFILKLLATRWFCSLGVVIRKKTERSTRRVGLESQLQS